jgi:TDG/mug DNA glycosylase family protein
MRFSRADLEGYRGRTLPDLVGPGTRLLFVGINPGLRSTAIGAHFGGGSNRFYPTLYRAGIVDRRIDASAGLSPADEAQLLERGVGITSLVAGASARADELSSAQLIEAADALGARVAAIAPAVVAFLGITAYRVAFRAPRAALGLQADPLGGAALWVVPNPSGLNRGTSAARLAEAYREVALAAGIAPFEVPG